MNPNSCISTATLRSARRALPRAGAAWVGALALLVALLACPQPAGAQSTGAEPKGAAAGAAKAATKTAAKPAIGAMTQPSSKPAAKTSASPSAKATGRPSAAARKAAGKATLNGSTKGPVAARNVAVGSAAAPAAPTAVLTHGCAVPPLDGRIAGELGVAALEALGAATPAQTIEPPACVPFAAVRSLGQPLQTLALLSSAAPEAGIEARRALVVSQQTGAAAEPLRSWHDMPAPTGVQPELWLSVNELLAGQAAGIPARLTRELTLLVRQMKRGAEDAPWVRLVLSDESEAARLAAVELVDANGEALDSAIWIDRGAAAPGGFISTRGSDHERILWQSPVDFRRISRGVGWANIVVRKQVVVAPKAPGGRSRVVVRSFRSRGQHQGIDFAAPTGTPVVTVADGTVVHAGLNGGYGNLVVVDHGGGITTYYAHLSAYGEGVQEGARVERGQEIGQVGSTGRSTGPHLHFEIRRDGKYLDPADPKQTLPNWGLAADEQARALLRLLELADTRTQSFAAATRRPAQEAGVPFAATLVAE
jgi:murein DD-endopeptidase MepM/ murein hydrolase activator NlpD